MRFLLLLLAGYFYSQTLYAQVEPLSPETLWTLGRTSPIGLSPDGDSVDYRVSHPRIDSNDFVTSYFRVAVTGGSARNLAESPDTKKYSPNGKYVLYDQEVLVQAIRASDRYNDLPDAHGYVWDALAYRHWDHEEDGHFQHVFYRPVNASENEAVDIMAGEPYHCPQSPFGGPDDYIWSPDGQRILYVAKKKEGTEYALSTNTDIYAFDLESRKTENLTPNNPGYDQAPAFSPQGHLSWLQMSREGYEADKNDIILRIKGTDYNLTAHWDETVRSFYWSSDGNQIYFTAAWKGTVQLFSLPVDLRNPTGKTIRQITRGSFDVTGLVAEHKEGLIVTRRDFNRASEIFLYRPRNKSWLPLSRVNDEAYAQIASSRIEDRWIPTTDGKEMLTWVIYPPGFDPDSIYPTLLYCQGGPQGALSQFYSFRWNFQLMAAQGYIIVAPNRRGMPGHGTEWNEQISKDWGGQAMEDYLTAIDALAQEPFVDSDRLGAVGASYGGYSVFQLAGIHENRFRSFISHAGVFNLESMYGTTEELFFVNWDIGGPYWDESNAAARRSYREFNPMRQVDQWDTPILITQGGKDYRVPMGQSQEAFQAAQLQGIKSRFVLFPEENHWILSPQNGIAWQREFFRWLDETL